MQRDLQVLFPVREWFGDVRAFGWQAALFGLFALAPFLFLHMAESAENLRTIMWWFAIYFAAMWWIALRQVLNPGPLPIAWLAGVIGFTGLVGTWLAIEVEQKLQPDPSELLWAIGGIGLVEEVAKAIPVLAFAFFTRHRGWPPRMYMFVGAASGLAFGTFEAVGYSTLYAEAGAYLGLSDVAPVTVWRLVCGGVFHACFTAVVAYFVGLAVYRRDRAAMFVAFGLGVSSVLHGAYDRWADDWAGFCLAALTVGLFLGYVRSGDRIAFSVGSLPRRDAAVAVDANGVHPGATSWGWS